MSANLYYLMTMLPSLPALGERVEYSEALSKLREDKDGSISYLADLLESELSIEECGRQYYVLGNKDYVPTLYDALPESFSEILNSYKFTDEAVWLSTVYKAWFSLILDVGRKFGSGLLSRWAKWEYSLRLNLIAARLNKSGNEQSVKFEVLPDDLSSDYSYETLALVTAYKSFNEPFEAEKYLDQSRIDFLRRESTQFSFSIDELVSYMLEMRIHNRYSQLSPELGNKILEEVTKL
ncbi:MAG: DUF2764 family protein [Candidatus Riflebacteria bacterium]|nr:DUF2764 family protein [Candidatus Riflebacteria bacterium]